MWKMVIQKQTRIKILQADKTKKLEKKANEFCKDKKIIDIRLYLSAILEDKLLIIYND